MKKLTLALCALSFLSFFSCKKDVASPSVTELKFTEPFSNGASGQIDYTRIDSCHIDKDTLYMGHKFFSAYFFFHTTGPRVNVSVLSRDGSTPPDFFMIWWRKDTINGQVREGWVW